MWIACEREIDNWVFGLVRDLRVCNLYQLISEIKCLSTVDVCNLPNHFKYCVFFIFIALGISAML